MKRIAAVLLVLSALALTGCDDRSHMEICLDAGGSYTDTAWGDSCTLPNSPTREDNDDA